MTAEEMKEHHDFFWEIIQDNLLTILETRPRNPVSKFSKMILDAASLDKNGDPIPDREQPPKRKERKKLPKDDSDDEGKKKKKKREDDSDEDEKPNKKANEQIAAKE